MGIAISMHSEAQSEASSEASLEAISVPKAQSEASLKASSEASLEASLEAISVPKARTATGDRGRVRGRQQRACAREGTRDQ